MVRPRRNPQPQDDPASESSSSDDEHTTCGMAGIGGQLTPYDEKEETIANFLLRVKHYIKANKVSEELKVSVLLTVLGPRLVTTLQDLLAPAEVDSFSFTKLTEALTNHFKPCTLTIVERFKFNSRTQEANESISSYVVTLKHMASTCNFGTFLKDALRDRLVSGIRDDFIRQRLLTDELDLEGSLQKALMLEEAIKQKSTFGVLPESVNRVRSDQRARQSGKKPKDKGSQQSSQPPPTSDKEAEKRKKPCYRCGAVSHAQFNCPYKSYKCNACQSVGHLAKVCKKSKKVQNVNSEVNDDCIYRISSNGVGTKPYLIRLDVNNVAMSFEVDTGSLYSIISNKTYEDFLRSCPIQPSRVKLTAIWFSENLPLRGSIVVDVKHRDVVHSLELMVLDSGSRTMPSLLGRQWIAALQILSLPADPTPTATVQRIDQRIEQFQQRYPSVFDAHPGHIKKFQASIVLKEGAVPVFCKARPIPFALRAAVDAELDKMEKDNVITRVKHSDWATPLVVVPKPKGVRICADYKVTLNRVLQMEHYPLPSSKDIFAKMVGGKFFSILDLKGAYLQLPVREDCRHLLTVNTHRGLYRYNYLVYGLASSPSIFQSVMDEILRGVKGVSCYIDDVILCGKTEEEAYAQLHQVFGLFSKYNIKVNIDKCKFFMPEVQYLGYVVNEEGVKPSKDLLKSIQDAPEPTDKSELKSYLGLLNFYNDYIPHASDKLAPLYDLTKNHVPWVWTGECSEIFKRSKTWLCSSSLLTFYDSRLPLRLTTDASARGVGAVLSHVIDGKEKPISFASKMLSTAESSYSQLDREALGIIFGIKKFHRYLYGRHFELVCDNKPLTFIFGEKKGISPMASARLQRWAILLAAYDYHIVHKQGKTIGNADFLSRCPIADSEPVEQPFNAFSGVNRLASVLLVVDSGTETALTAADIASETKKDDILQQVFNFVRWGWPATLTDTRFDVYARKRDELSVDGDCILWGSRVAIPATLQPRVLQLLHSGHPGIVKMKALARSYVWWPKMDEQMEAFVSTCTSCQQVRSATARAPLHHWPVPTRRWQRLHIDFAQITFHQGPQKNMLLVVDAYSKWLEVFLMGSTTAEKTIDRLRTLFARYGLPEEIVSDNGVQFTSGEFADFLSRNRIKHVLTPPYHAQSNGAIERCVQTTKLAIQKQVLDQPGTGLQHKLDNFLYHYRSTPHSTTLKTPAEVFLGWMPRTHLSLLKPSLAQFVEQRQRRVEEQANVRRKEPVFAGQDPVWIKTRRGETEQWVPGVVLNQKSPLTFRVSVGSKEEFVHADHIRTRTSVTPVEPAPTVSAPAVIPDVRRSGRERRPPDRLCY